MEAYMEHIRSFRVESLTLEGFKNFGESKTFDFGDVNYITGHNGLGKTTIADAVAYAIAGVPFSGEQSLDRLYAIGARDMRVELSVTADGAAHTLVRERHKGNTSVTWDGAIVRQSDITALFGEKDVFLSIFNPLYFIEALGDKGRDLLERCLPPVPHEAVMERLSGPVRELLKNERILSPGAYLEKLKADIRELESGATYTEGQRDMLTTQSMDAKVKLTAKQAELSAADAGLAALEAKHNSGDMAALRKLRGTLYAQYEAASRDDSIAAEAAKETASYQLARKRYMQDDTVMKNLRPGVICPTCKYRITEENVEHVKKSFADSIAAITAEGNAIKAKLAGLKAQTEKRSEYLYGLKAQIQSVELDIECGGLAPDEKQQLDSLKKARDTLAAELDALQKVSRSDPSAKDSELARLRDAITQKRKLESAAKIYAEERYALLFKSFDTLNRVKVVLYETVKRTGEAKGVFKFSYEDRPYKYLSPSEKTKAGLELSELMKVLTNSDYPVFIDNGESVPVIDNVRPSGQIFVSQVVKQAPLEVRTSNNAVAASNTATAAPPQAA
jgi:DNA repair exonuclease SbcCD ATPase subunit